MLSMHRRDGGGGRKTSFCFMGISYIIPLVCGRGCGSGILLPLLAVDFASARNFITAATALAKSLYQITCLGGRDNETFRKIIKKELK